LAAEHGAVPAWEPPPPPDRGDWTYITNYVVVSSPAGLLGRWVGGDTTADVRECARHWAASARGQLHGPHRRPGCTYLRLRVKHVPPDLVAAIGRTLAVDVDFGPSGAPVEYPRVDVDTLLSFAALNL
jgi:hypothetical protein